MSYPTAPAICVGPGANNDTHIPPENSDYGSQFLQLTHKIPVTDKAVIGGPQQTIDSEGRAPQVGVRLHRSVSFFFKNVSSPRYDWSPSHSPAPTGGLPISFFSNSAIQTVIFTCEPSLGSALTCSVPPAHNALPFPPCTRHFTPAVTLCDVKRSGAETTGPDPLLFFRSIMRSSSFLGLALVSLCKWATPCAESCPLHLNTRNKKPDHNTAETVDLKSASKTGRRCFTMQAPREWVSLSLWEASYVRMSGCSPARVTLQGTSHVHATSALPRNPRFDSDTSYARV